MPSTPRPLLLVEGREDQEVIFQLCNAHGFPNRDLLEVKDCKGVDGLLGVLGVEAARPQVLGVVLDADADPTSRWRALRARVSAYFPALPEAPVPGGVSVPGVERGARLGVWLMPNNGGPGMLEDLLLSLIPSDDPLLAHARATVDTLPERRFPEARRSKAQLHTYLAWQHEPGTRPSTAITQRLLAPDRGTARRFMDWLRGLYAP